MGRNTERFRWFAGATLVAVLGFGTFARLNASNYSLDTPAKPANACELVLSAASPGDELTTRGLAFDLPAGLAENFAIRSVNCAEHGSPSGSHIRGVFVDFASDDLLVGVYATLNSSESVDVWTAYLKETFPQGNLDFHTVGQFELLGVSADYQDSDSVVETFDGDGPSLTLDDVLTEVFE